MLKLIIGAVLAALVALAGAFAGQGLTDGDDFDQRVRDYLLRHPEVIIEAMQVWQERQRIAELEAIQGLIAARSEDIFNDPQSPVGGNPEGDVTIVEFFDYNCPHCRRVTPVLAEAERGDSKLRIVYKELPVLGPDSVFAARAALASRQQGGYLAFHKAMMHASERLTEAKVMEIAQAIGLDTERLQADMEGPMIQHAIERNHKLAHALGITGTPSFVIGDTVLRGATDLRTLRREVQEAREKGQTSLPENAQGNRRSPNEAQRPE